MNILKFNEHNENTYIIYCYVDPRKPGNFEYGKYKFDFEPIYIGKGKERRVKAHNYLVNLKNTRFYTKLKSIISNGFKLKYEIIERNLTEDVALKMETEIIKLIGRIENGGPLTNHTNGGEGHSGFKKSDITRDRLSKSLKAKYKTNVDDRMYKYIKTAKEIHCNKYDYSLVDYSNAHTKVDIICPEHGVFSQELNAHSRGSQCPSCTGNRKSNTIEFIEKSNAKHNNKYDYSKCHYINNRTKVTIICPEHGEFEQIPETHLKGKGCPLCGNGEKNTQYFIDKSNITHNNKYDYSKSEYTGIFNKLTIICPKHGEFEQIAKNHMDGRGCRQCALDKRKKSL